LLPETSDFSDYFDMNDLRKVIHVITADEYLDLQLVSKDSKLRKDRNLFKEYLRQRSYLPNWNFHEQVLAIPNRKVCEEDSNNEVFGWPSLKQFKGFRKQILEFPKEMLNSTSIHFVTKNGGPRLFGLWYTFFYFSNVQQTQFYVEMLKNYLHYTKDIVYAASQMIGDLNEKSNDSSYVALHIRRGDFQYKQTRIEIDKLLSNIRPLLGKPNRLLYIATDEKNQTVFEPLRKEFQVVFLTDYHVMLKEESKTPQRLWGMVEQLVCVGAQTFIGTELSTFSAYITRMRAYAASELSEYEEEYNRNIYFTTRKYTGLPESDNLETYSTWMYESKPSWPHSPWSREFWLAFSSQTQKEKNLQIKKIE
jgi:hypothetical protein